MAATSTPATQAAARAGLTFVVHEYEHDPRSAAYGLEAVQALGLDPARVFKTLVVSVGDQLTVCVVPSAATLDLRSLGKHAEMAPVRRAESVTGYVAGGISPLGQRRQLPTFIDDSALVFETIFVSAGRRGLSLEISPSDLISATAATIRPLRRER